MTTARWNVSTLIKYEIASGTIADVKEEYGRRKHLDVRELRVDVDADGVRSVTASGPRILADGFGKSNERRVWSHYGYRSLNLDALPASLHDYIERAVAEARPALLEGLDEIARQVELARATLTTRATS